MNYWNLILVGSQGLSLFIMAWAILLAKHHIWYYITILFVASTLLVDVGQFETNMPSEAEWEYAARSGTRTRYSWGNRIGANRANCDGCRSRWDNDRTAPVGSFAANPFGLHDMHGNVAEWVEDCWHDDYRGAPSDGSAWTSGGDCDLRVVRGGAWFFFPQHLRSAARFSSALASRKSLVGFRLVQDLTP